MSTAVHPYAEIVDALRSPYASDDLVPDASVPLLVTDVTGRTVDREAAHALKALPAVTVAVGDDASGASGAGMAAFDVLVAENPAGGAAAGAGAGAGADSGAVHWLAPDGGVASVVATIDERVRSHPQASVAAVRLLRLSEGLDTVDGLVAESLTYSTLQAGPEFAHWLDHRPTRGGIDVDPVPLLVERSEKELRLVFNRPEIHNAFGFEVRDALVEALQLAAADPGIESVRLTGRGPSFCSGGDLREFGTLPDPASAHLIRTTRSAGYWIDRVAERVHVELHGACIGAGIELSAFAGHVTAAEDVVVELPEVGMGLVPGAGGTVSLPRRIGRHRSAYLTLTGERLPAHTALAWGLVDELS